MPANASSPPFETIAVVGLGLLGGSIALAARERGVARRVIGVGRSEERLKQAIAAGIVQEGVVDLKAAAAKSQLVVLCTPVDRIAEHAREAGSAAAANCLLTDVGSTKEVICADLCKSPPANGTFIGSHPLAGSDRSGFEAAKATLFVGKLVVVTPTGQPEEWVSQIEQFWSGLGAQTRRMTPESHDKAVAFTSHLPHVAAAALAGVLPAVFEDMVATGFRDTTRVARGDTELWASILESNAASVALALAVLQGNLAEWHEALAAGDRSRLAQLLEQGKTVRDRLSSVV